MLKVYKTNNDGTLEKLDKIEENTWVDLVNPTDDELKETIKGTGVPANLLIKMLDSDETARIEKSDEATLIVIDVPHMEDKKIKNRYQTLPLGLITCNNYLITISLTDTGIIEDAIENRIKSVFTDKKTRVIIQILNRVAANYLKLLKNISDDIENREKAFLKTTSNKDLIQLMQIQKSLVFFETGLKANEIILEKLEKGNLIEFYEEDLDVLEDSIIENRQGIETAIIYREIVASMSETYTGIMSNNLNQIMKFLAGITIVFSIPTMISSFIGMNVPLGELAHSDYSFMFIVSISIISALVIAFILKKKDML
ncbi:MAG: magnesium transporter CorA family protein [Bacilli bacterium]